MIAYPSSPAARTRWILDRRTPDDPPVTGAPAIVFSERERTASGEIAQVLTILLRNRECPWKCVMCDLWRNTVPANSAQSISTQIHAALHNTAPSNVLKLYNSGSFFDPCAVPLSEWPGIAALCTGFERVIVECHPRLVSDQILHFRDLLPGILEVAMGLETCHPKALEALNKRMTLDDFRHAAEFLARNLISVRSFLLVHPPFIPGSEQQTWLRRSIQFAFDCGSTVVSLIPTRPGNGAMDELLRQGLFHPPRLTDLEDAHELALALQRGRVFVDTWELARFAECEQCLPERLARVARMNDRQGVEPRVVCSFCGNQAL